MNKEYRITFLEPRTPWNWATVTSIDKATFLGFVDYLYNLDRDIEIQPFIQCGFTSSSKIKPNMDKTYLVKRIVRRIKDNDSKEEVFEEFTYLYNEDNKAQIFFIEDVYEMLLSFGLTKDFAIEIANKHHCSNDFEKDIPICVNDELLGMFMKQFEYSAYYPYHSRWMFVYMFRNEFIRYMKFLGYDSVSVDGGLLSNDKEEKNQY